MSILWCIFELEIEMKFPLFSHGCRITTWNYKRLNWGWFWWKYDLGWGGVVTCNVRSEETLGNVFFWTVWTRLASWIELGFSFLVPHFSNSGTVKFPCQKHEVFGRNTVLCVSSSPVLGLFLPGSRGQRWSPVRGSRTPAHGTQRVRQRITDSPWSQGRAVIWAWNGSLWQLLWLRGWFCVAQHCVILSPLNLTLK